MNIKCPNCGGPLVFDVESGNMKCDYCGRISSKEEFSRSIVYDRVSKEQKPSKIIPFKLSEAQALACIKDRFGHGSYIPPTIRELTPDKVRAIYIPFWLYNAYIRKSVTITARDMDGYDNDEQLTELELEDLRREQAPAAEIDEAILVKDLPPDRDAALAILQAQAATDTDIQGIIDNAAVYPDIVLRNLASNSELKQYAIDYIAKINIVFDGNFDMEVNASEVPLFLQYDEQWGYADYANDLIAFSGSAPTCLSIDNVTC